MNLPCVFGLLGFQWELAKEEEQGYYFYLNGGHTALRFSWVRCAEGTKGRPRGFLRVSAFSDPLLPGGGGWGGGSGGVWGVGWGFGGWGLGAAGVRAMKARPRCLDRIPESLRFNSNAQWISMGRKESASFLGWLTFLGNPSPKRK